MAKLTPIQQKSINEWKSAHQFEGSKFMSDDAIVMFMKEEAKQGKIYAGFESLSQSNKAGKTANTGVIPLVSNKKSNYDYWNSFSAEKQNKPVEQQQTKVQVEAPKLKHLVTQISPKGFDINSLKKQYPESQYKFSVDKTTGEITVTNKKDNGEFAKFTKYSSYKVFPNGDMVTQEYYEDGAIDEYTFENRATALSYREHNNKLVKSKFFTTDAKGNHTQIYYDKEGFVDQAVVTDKDDKTLYYKTKGDYISNDFYKSKSTYGIEFSRNKLVVKNEQTNQVAQINLKEYLSQIPQNQKAEYLEYISNLPGEVLFDLAKETSKVIPLNKTDELIDKMTYGNSFKSDGYYNSLDDSYHVASTDAMVHELGHTLDFTGKAINTASSEGIPFVNDTKLEKSFEKELKNMLKTSSIKQFDYNDESTDSDTNYATANVAEMFAESYELLMTGDCDSKEVIVKYFPETLKLVEQQIQKNRALPDDKRRPNFKGEGIKRYPY